MEMISHRLTAAMTLFLIFTGCSLPGHVPDKERFRVLEERAYAGDPESQYQLGLQYTIDGQWAWHRVRGYDWLVTAAENGHADAQYMAGMGKLLGRGTLYDEDGAVKMFRLSSQQGQARAQYQLGLAYLDGRGVAQDRPWGRQWLEQAAWNGHMQAQFMLGALFAKGIGGQESLAEAWRWLEKSRLSGQAQSEMALARLQKSMTSPDRMAGKVLLAQQPRIAKDGLYANPRLRYVQTMLNRIGYLAGIEDGLPGPRTDAAMAAFLRANKLPRETQIMQLVESLRGKY